jgi:hypothetical protein
MAGLTTDARAQDNHLPDRVTIGVLTTTFPPELVDKIIDETGARETRSRSLPARLTCYFVLALWLYMGCGYGRVITNLVDGLLWSGHDNDPWTIPSTGSLTKARARLGSTPLRALFAATAGPVAAPGMKGAFWRDLRVVAIDGTSFDLPDSPENRAEFGGPTTFNDQSGAFPQATMVALAECGTRAIIDAEIGKYKDSEQKMAHLLTRSMTEGMLVLADRAYPSTSLWKAAAARGSQLLWRVKARRFLLPVEKVLPDGTYLTHLTQDRTSPVVRVIDYRVTTYADSGQEESEVFRLVTTLLDPDAAPMLELARLYADRWEVEIVFSAVKTTQRGGPAVALRSRHADGVYQELWAMLCVYQALRSVMATAAVRVGVPASRISFVAALDAARRSVDRVAVFPPV